MISRVTALVQSVFRQARGWLASGTAAFPLLFFMLLPHLVRRCLLRLGSRLLHSLPLLGSLLSRFRPGLLLWWMLLLTHLLLLLWTLLSPVLAGLRPNIGVRRSSQVAVCGTSHIGVCRTSHVAVCGTAHIAVGRTSQVAVCGTSHIGLCGTSHIAVARTTHIPVGRARYVAVGRTGHITPVFVPPFRAAILKGRTACLSRRNSWCAILPACLAGGDDIAAVEVAGASSGGDGRPSVVLRCE